MSPTELSRTLIKRLADVELRFEATTYVQGLDVEEVGVLEWTATGIVAVSAENAENLGEGLGWTTSPGVALGDVASDGNGNSVLEVFTMSGVTIDLERAGSLNDVLDARSASTARFLPLVDASTGELRDDLVDRLVSDAGRLVIVDQAQVAPAWRGLGGVGRLLVGRCALAWVTPGALCVAVNPYPIEEDDADITPDIGTALQVVRHVWSSLGFVPVTESLYLLDPATNALSDAVARLEDELLPQVVDQP
jgi:hypothetical protein